MPPRRRNKDEEDDSEEEELQALPSDEDEEEEEYVTPSTSASSVVLLGLCHWFALVRATRHNPLPRCRAQSCGRSNSVSRRVQLVRQSAKHHAVITEPLAIADLLAGLLIPIPPQV